MRNNRPLLPVSEKISTDPAALANLPAFVSVVVDYLIAFEHPAENAKAPVCLLPVLRQWLTRPELGRRRRRMASHYQRYAKAAGCSLDDLAYSALAFHYFGPTAHR